MSALETRLREAIHKAGRDAIENGTDVMSQRMMSQLSAQGPRYLEASLNEIGNGYVKLILPVILPIIESETT